LIVRRRAFERAAFGARLPLNERLDLAGEREVVQLAGSFAEEEEVRPNEYGHKAEDFANRARAIAIQRMATDAANAHYQPKTQNEEPAPAGAEPAAKTPGTP